jgi:hypothetical protein
MPVHSKNEIERGLGWGALLFAASVSFPLTVTGVAGYFGIKGAKAAGQAACSGVSSYLKRRRERAADQQAKRLMEERQRAQKQYLLDNPPPKPPTKEEQLQRLREKYAEQVRLASLLPDDPESILKDRMLAKAEMEFNQGLQQVMG